VQVQTVYLAYIDVFLTLMLVSAAAVPFALPLFPSATDGGVTRPEKVKEQPCARSVAPAGEANGVIIRQPRFKDGKIGDVA
jgi:hypothetical protein